MRFRHGLWTLLGAAHLVIVLCGASRCLPKGSGGPVAQALAWYARMSGACSHYGFYAPEVGSRYRAKFLLQDDEGSTWCDTFEQAQSPEARLRLASSAECGFANGEADHSPRRRERLVKSWAAAMFTRHPSAVLLAVVVEVYDVPTMAEYRGGVGPSWKVVYQAQAQRDQERTGP